MSKRIVMVFLMLLCSILLLAEQGTLGMGLHFGNSTGSGYSFRKWGNTGNGIQWTFAAYTYGREKPSFAASIYNSDTNLTSSIVTKAGKQMDVTVGCNYLWNLSSTEKHKVYIISGGAVTINRKREHHMTYQRSGSSMYLYQSPDSIRKEWKNENNWAVGVGPGAEFKLGTNFGMTFELPFVLNSDSDITMYIPAVGLYYYFK